LPWFAVAALLPLAVVRTAARAADAVPPRYDLVIEGGRVMDPETGLDAVRNVGILSGRIAKISEAALVGARVIDARGQVVAPGFIDLHSHGQDLENDRLKVQDGVTTALELEIGPRDVAAFLAQRQGHALVNFGTSASHPAARVVAFGAVLPNGALVPPSGPATNDPASHAQIARMKELLRAQLDAGGIGVGMGINYTPGATRLEIIEMFRVAAERHVPVYVHMRSAGRIEPGSSIESLGEVIAAAAVTGAPLHVVHINSMGLRDSGECLRLIAGARARGLDVTTEGYPYGSGMTAINSALFNPGWRERLGIDYGALRLVSTGERLTAESFARYHASPDAGLVTIDTNPAEIVDEVMLHPLTMVASDGIITGGKGHPRGAGTFARVLARYVRSQGRLSLMDAIRKSSLMPAQRLEGAVAVARRKGRLQEGADADVVVFDSATIADHATYEHPAEPSVGMRLVLVGGVPVFDGGRVVETAYPGRALTP
jgi:N-acyl-D-aspartate/D-glutamate deacylase